MIVTTSNILLGKTPSVIEGINAVFDTANITDPSIH